MATDEDRIVRAGYTPNGRRCWRKSAGDAVLVLEPAYKDGSEWWLHMACDDEAPRMTFAGSLRSCLDVDRKVVKLLGEWGLV